MSGKTKTFEAAFGNLVRATVSAPGNLVSEVDRLRMVREKTLSLLGEVTAEKAERAPRPGAWSIAQIADHVLRSEEVARGEFERLIQAAREGRSSVIEVSLKESDISVAGIPRKTMQLFETPARVFNMFMPHPVREMMIRHQFISALNPKASEPRPGMTLEKLRQDLAASLTETEALLRAPMPANVDRPTIDHPLMGRNNLLQLLRLAIAHEERHQAQIEALKA